MAAAVCHAEQVWADAAWQTVSGVPLPGYRAFQMLPSAGTMRLPVVCPHQVQEELHDASGRHRGDHAQIRLQNGSTSDSLDSTLSIFATKNNGSTSDISARIYSHFAPDDGSGVVPVNYTRTVILELQGLADLLADRSLDDITVTATTINSTCANPKFVWKTEMGSIKWPNAQQLQALHHASEPCTENLPVSALHHSTSGTADTVAATTVGVTVTLEPYAAVALVVS